MPPLEPEDRPEDKPPAERRAAAVSKRGQKVVDGLAKQFGMLGMFVYLGNRYDGEVLMTQALPMAESLEQVGRKNKAFYRVLVLLAEESEWTALFMAFGGTTVGIGANHGLFPAKWTRAFQLPPPPNKQGTETEQQTSSGGPSMGLPPETSEHVVQDKYGNEWHATPDGATVPPSGLHISEDQFNRIREQAAQEVLRQYRLAEQQGILP